LIDFQEGNMNLSIFLAQLFGVYLIVAGIMYVARHHFIRSVINDYFDSPSVVFIGGMLSLIFGLMIILGHNIWEPNWKVIITLFGYLMFFKGIMHWFFPQQAARWAEKMAHGTAYLYASIFMIALGCFFGYIGFFQIG